MLASTVVLWSSPPIRSKKYTGDDGVSLKENALCCDVRLGYVGSTEGDIVAIMRKCDENDNENYNNDDTQ